MKDEMNEKEPEVTIEDTGEENMDEPLIEEVEATSQSKIKKLQTKLKECETEKAKHHEDLQRVKAEFLNAKKRLEEESSRNSEKLTEAYIQKLLPLCDSFYMAMQNKEAWESVDESWRAGVESIQTQLRKILDSFSVEEVNPLGEEFDPTIHEALQETEVENESESNTITTVIQTGFVMKRNDQMQVIRPARVAVGILKK